jgi:hypothetical protein
MLAFLAEKDSLKRDEIAARQIHVLRQHQGENERPIKLHEVKQMFQAKGSRVSVWIYID